MPASPSHAVLDLLDRYLATEAGAGRDWVYQPVPLRLEVKMPVDHWRSYFEAVEIASGHASGVEEALMAAEGRGHIVDRRALAAASADAGRSANATVAAWVTVMCWGAGPTNRWRLRQWHRSLARPSLAEDLQRTIDLVEHDRLAEAYEEAPLPGCSESFFTKWLWLLGLDSQRRTTTQPLVYDTRVDKVRRLLRWQPIGRSRAERWTNYCRTLATWATDLNHCHPGWTVDAERLEQLMFQRTDTGGPCLYTWLSTLSSPGTRRSGAKIGVRPTAV